MFFILKGLPLNLINKKSFFFIILIVFFILIFSKLSVVLAKSCPSNTPIKAGKLYSISEINPKNKTRLLKPSFFGFNLEWIGFQDSFWDKKSKKINPALLEWMKAFKGAVYRYPGGTVANYFDWMEAKDDIQLRKLQIGADWRGPLIARFGIDEYLTFVNQVSGQPWIVTNLFGRFHHEMPVETLAKQAGTMAKYVSTRNKQLGFSPVLRWELGNELDRGIYQWPAEKYSDRSAQIVKAITAEIPDAQFVAIAEDYDAQTKTSGLNAHEYNNQVVSRLANQVQEYANHLYYDGGINGPPIPDRLGQLCSTLDSLQTKLLSSKTANAGIWITEHARWPEGKPSDPNWKSQWWKATNLQAGISVADIMIAAVQFPQIKGAFLHALAGTAGSWPLFHADSEGSFHPSVIYWTLRILREAMLDEVLTTQTTSANLSAYAGNYDVRATVLTSKDHKRYAIWAINRHASPVELDVNIQLCSACSLKFKKTELTNHLATADNRNKSDNVLPQKSTGSLKVNKLGHTKVMLSGYSITTYIFDIP